jgi:hypothetical protein
VNHLIERTWPGWTALWSPEGVRGILWLAGVDPATIFANGECSPRTADDLEWFAPCGDNGHDGAISIRLDDSKGPVTWRGESFLDIIAEIGPDLIRAVAVETRARGKVGEPVLWDSQPRDNLPCTGIHVDFVTKVVRWWALRNLSRCLSPLGVKRRSSGPPVRLVWVG